MSAEGPLEANLAFYQAFSDQDLQRMDALWARRAPVRCVHPNWDALITREDVMSSWMAIFAGGGQVSVRCVEPQSHQVGEMALVGCREQLEETTLVATNAFVLEDGVWRMVLHQAAAIVQRVEFTKPPEHLN